MTRSDAPHLLHVFSTFAPGGPQVRTVGLIAALGGAFRHSVIPMDGRSDAAALLRTTPNVPSAPNAPNDLNEASGASRANEPSAPRLRVLAAPPRASPIAMVRALRAIFTAEQPDLVLTYNWGAIEAVLAARTLGLPVVHHEDGFLPDEAAGFKRRRVWTRRLLLRGARAVIVPSRRLESIARDLWRLSDNLHWIPNGIRPTELASANERQAARASFGIPQDAVVIGGVGHLRGEKNFARLVEAFALLAGRSDAAESSDTKRTDAAARSGSTPRAHLLLLGDGPERARIEELGRAPSIAGRVHLPGHRADLRPAYAAMDAFAISSDTEQMPIALLEAMVAGLPVASTDVGDVRAMLPAEQGELVVPLAGGAAALANALARLLASAELRANLGRANRVTALQRFGYERMVAAHRERYRDALHSATAGRGAERS